MSEFFLDSGYLLALEFANDPYHQTVLTSRHFVQAGLAAQP